MDVGVIDGLVDEGMNKRVRPGGAKRRMAIVSTFDELCGIASYTRSLLPQLEGSFHVEVMDLDQYLLKSKEKRVQQLAERHIHEMADRLRAFDCVNIQLEHGTLGRTPRQILRRFKILTNAAPELSVTFHTVMGGEPFAWSAFWGFVFTGRLDKASGVIGAYRRARALAHPLYAFLRTLGRRKKLHLIVHSKREMRLLENVHRLENVHHHPLSYLDAGAAAAIRAMTSRASFPSLDGLPPTAKLVGTFGFLSPYKGFETVIRAMSYLPEDYHVLIFGSIHPQTIKKGLAIDEYVAKLLKEANIGQTVFDRLADTKAANLNLSLDVGNDTSLLTGHPKDMSARLHFMGALSDSEFAGAMSVCDTVVVPYIEVGQSASGPISIALDMGCRVIASRTSTFLQLSRYHPGALEFFDIGNFVELAQRIRSPAAGDPRARVLAYNTDTNAAIYRVANGVANPERPSLEGPGVDRQRGIVDASVRARATADLDER